MSAHMNSRQVTLATIVGIVCATIVVGMLLTWGIVASVSGNRGKDHRETEKLAYCQEHVPESDRVMCLAFLDMGRLNDE